MGKRARQAYQRRLARQGPPKPLPQDLGFMYGRQGGIQEDEDTAYTFDMGEILWALGTGQLTGQMAEVAAAAWLANLMEGRENDPLAVTREFTEKLGLDPARAYEIAQLPTAEAKDLPGIAKELIDSGLLPPPPGQH